MGKFTFTAGTKKIIHPSILTLSVVYPRCVRFWKGEKRNYNDAFIGVKLLRLGPFYDKYYS